MINPLHELDNIHASQKTKEKTINAIVNKQKRSSFHKRWLFLPTIVCCLLIYFIAFPLQNQDNQPIAYVSLDINPSLELRLNDDYQVIKVVAYNQDAKNIIKHIEIQKLSLQEAISRLLTDQNYTNYLKNGILEVGVYSSNQDISVQIETIVNNLLDKKLEINQYHCSQIDESTHHKASSHHTTGGKYRIIESIFTYTKQYTFEELNQLSIQKLYTILYQYNQAEVPENCHSQSSHHQSHH